MTDKNQPKLIATRIFEMKDQERFAEFSGDANPLHLDRNASRRTQAGAPSVYGVLQVLWALECLPQSLLANAHITSLRARFLNFLVIDEEARLELTEQAGNAISVNVSAGGSVCTILTVNVAEGKGDSLEQKDNYPSVPSGICDCQNLTIDDVENLSGDIPVQFGAQNASQLFSRATVLIGATRITAIAALSRLVGMICPGLHSIFSSIDLRIVNEQDDRIRFSVTKTDKRYSFLRQKVDGGGIEGSIDAFFRTPPTKQPSAQFLRQLVAADEFSGSTALVVGASRGLGEFAAKAVGVGGGRVLATYRVGREECESIANEIRACGGTCDVLSYDVAQSASLQLKTVPAIPTSLYYFATPKIASRHSNLFDFRSFSEFSEVYLNGFFDLCSHLRRLGVQRLAVFYPSSIAIESRPPDMGIYAMVKAAAELLCDEMANRWPEFRVIVRRLPRILTDQTASVLNLSAARIEDVLLPIIREVENGLGGEPPAAA